MSSADPLEIAVCIVCQFVEGEGIVILFDNALEIGDLIRVYHADQNGLGRAGVCAVAIEFGNAVAKLMGDFVSNLIGVGSNDREFISGFCTFNNVVAYKV